jgi:excinuclease UvrABC nuclease subunit
LLRTVHRLFQGAHLRSCADAGFHRCEKIQGSGLDYPYSSAAPVRAEDHISQQEYQQTVEDVRRFISGRSRKWTEELQRRMQRLAADLEIRRGCTGSANN